MQVDPQNSAPQRRKNHVAEAPDEGAFMWAVSYADMLMVLMSFFVVYFQYDDLVRENEQKKAAALALAQAQKPVEKPAPVPSETLQHLASGLIKQGSIAASPHKEVAILQSTSPAQAGSLAKETPELPAAPSMPKSTEVLLEKIASQLDSQQVHWVKTVHEKTLTIYMSDNAYAVGSYTLNSARTTELAKILDVIRQVEKEDHHALMVSFTGHNDGIPLAVSNGKTIISSNLVLAGLRATKAADLAVARGLLPEHVRAEIQRESERNTRSLTVRVTEVEQ